MRDNLDGLNPKKIKSYWSGDYTLSYEDSKSELNHKCLGAVINELELSKKIIEELQKEVTKLKEEVSNENQRSFK